MLNIKVSERQFSRQKRGVQIAWKKVFLLSFLLVVIALAFIEKGNFSSALRYILFTKKNILVYDTYTFAFDDSVPSDIRDMVVEGLGELKLGDVNRFEFVEKKSDILLSKNQEEGMIELFSKNFIPVAHLYSLEDDISKDSLKKFNLFMLDSKYEKYLEGQYSVDIEVLDSRDQLEGKLAVSDKNIAFSRILMIWMLI